MYFALISHSGLDDSSSRNADMSKEVVPFGGISLLFHLCKNTLGLVVYAMRTFWHFPITLYLLLPAHIARL